MAPLVQAAPTDREYVTVLTAHTGSAELPLSKATIFSHLMLMTLDEIDSQVKGGVFS
ncbi:hypothetical protein [Mycobacteroides chelonae]|uniref:hypothetical protein n=1 Tax=Mycobacteroides chelonae TaxID=1774 RepID=UPI001C655246|nr:hypothetical protein [Mycobacteroides chelonae]